MNDFRYGIKLWTKNEESFLKCIQLLDEKTFDYLELYIVPDNFNSDSLLQFSNHEVILHAPSFNHNFNLIDKNEVFQKSLKSIKEVSEVVNSSLIIVHPGVQTIDLRQKLFDIVIANLKEIQELGLEIILENVPALALDSSTKMVASKYEDFKYVTNAAKTLVCIDVTHTICSANAYNIDPLIYLKKFIELDPFMIHFCNGNLESLVDLHLDIDKGNFPLKEILRMIPRNASISLETPKTDFKGLTNDVRNLELLKHLLKDI